MKDVIIDADGNIDFKETILAKVKNILDTHFNHSILRPEIGILKNLILDIKYNPFAEEVFKLQLKKQLEEAGITIQSMTVEEKEFFDHYVIKVLNPVDSDSTNESE